MLLHVSQAVVHLLRNLHFCKAAARLPCRLHVCHHGYMSATMVACLPRWLQVCDGGCTYARLAASLPWWLHICHAGWMFLHWLHVRHAGCTSDTLVARLPCSLHMCSGRWVHVCMLAAFLLSSSPDCNSSHQSAIEPLLCAH
jgi:hypothetical protein